MNTFERFFEELADIVQSWSKSTVSIIIGVLIALTFYFFAQSLKGLKSDMKKITNWGTIFIFFVCFGAMILFFNLLNY